MAIRVNPYMGDDALIVLKGGTHTSVTRAICAAALALTTTTDGFLSLLAICSAEDNEKKHM